MSLLVDSNIWSEILRRKDGRGNSEVLERLREGILYEGAILLGAIRQEVLSGIRDSNHFMRIRESLRAYPDFVPSQHEYELAGEFYSKCQSSGIQPTHIDMLICAVAATHDFTIFTLDRDFEGYAKHLPIRLLEAKA